MKKLRWDLTVRLNTHYIINFISEKVVNKMDTHKKETSTKKWALVTVGTAAVIATAGLFLSQSTTQSTNFLSLEGSVISEMEQDFLGYLARFGKSYQSKSDWAHRFGLFSANH
jgi:hypothetical protein